MRQGENLPFAQGLRGAGCDERGDVNIGIVALHDIAYDRAESRLSQCFSINSASYKAKRIEEVVVRNDDLVPLLQSEALPSRVRQRGFIECKKIALHLIKRCDNVPTTRAKKHAIKC